MIVYVFKAICIILILLLVLCVAGLYKVFEKLSDNDKSNDKGWVAFGLLWEVILIIIIAIKIIVG